MNYTNQVYNDFLTHTECWPTIIKSIPQFTLLRSVSWHTILYILNTVSWHAILYSELYPDVLYYTQDCILTYYIILRTVSWRVILYSGLYPDVWYCTQDCILTYLTVPRTVSWRTILWSLMVSDPELEVWNVVGMFMKYQSYPVLGRSVTLYTENPGLKSDIPTFALWSAFWSAIPDYIPAGHILNCNLAYWNVVRNIETAIAGKIFPVLTVDKPSPCPVTWNCLSGFTVWRSLTAAEDVIKPSQMLMT